jgi:ParB family chromosome partitioning protein
MNSLSDNAIAELLTAENAKTVITLPIEEIDPDPDQPRTHHNDESLRELAASIDQDGQQQPILVRELGERYRIVIGDRRWRACHLTRSRMIEEIVISAVSAGKILAIQIVENIQREAMHPLDEARSFQRLIDLKECKNAVAVANRVGKSEATISQALKLLTMPEAIKSLVATGVAKIDAALDLYQIAQHEPETAEQLATEARQKGLLERKTTREIKQKIEQKKGGKKPAAPKGSGSIAAPAPVELEPPTVGEAKVLIVPLKGGALRVRVGIRPSSLHASSFRVALREHGTALLVADGVHADETMAWVEFGEYRVAYPVADLSIVSVFREA